MDDNSDTTTNDHLYSVTPTIWSSPMSRHAGFDVYLKLENLQTPGSFKIRGIGEIYRKAVTRGYKRIVCASAGNAGVTAAYVARKLCVPLTVVLPQTTPDYIVKKILAEKATVVKHGSVFDESFKHAMTLTDEPGTLPPNCLQNPEVWAAYSTLITEAKSQMPKPPDVIVCCVGRGDLLNGVIYGMEQVGWKDVPLIAMETDGADSYNASVKVGKTVILPELKSIAQCLGALRCSSTAIKNSKTNNIISRVVSDKTAVNAVLKFADDHRMLVDVACGATLSAIYGDVISGLQAEAKIGNIKNALLVVCGGSVNLDVVLKWKKEVGL